jgi:rod shape determining protein RodA
VKDNQSLAFERLDWTTLIIYIALVLFGWMNIYSAAYDPLHPNLFDFSQEYGKQFIWVLVSFFLALLTLYVEGDFFNKLAIFIYGFFVLLLVDV